MHWDVLGGTGIHWYLLKCTGISWDGRSAIPGAVKILHSTLQFQPHRKSLQEITAGNPGRKSWQEILVGYLHRKSPQEILTGHPRRKSLQEIFAGNPHRKSRQEIPAGNLCRNPHRKSSQEIFAGNPHQKSSQEIPTGNPHYSLPASPDLSQQGFLHFLFQGTSQIPRKSIPFSFACWGFFFSPLIDLISVFSSQIQLPHHPLPQIFIFFAWQEAKRERGGGERKRKEKIV